MPKPRIPSCSGRCTFTRRSASCCRLSWAISSRLVEPDWFSTRQAGKIEMEDHDIRAALDRHWAASDANDFEAEHQIYGEDAVLEYPQSGERIRGRRNIQASRVAQPNRKRFTALPTSGSLNWSSLTMHSRLTR